MRESKKKRPRRCWRCEAEIVATAKELRAHEYACRLPTVTSGK